MDPLGKVLLANGALSDELLADVLEQQRRTMPIGSMCYILGILDEETLARALCRQFGMPSVVLERTVIALDALAAIPRDVAVRKNILPLYEDEQRIIVAAEDPRGVSSTLREIRFVRGKMPVLHIALQVTLARTVRAAYAARDAGERIYAGALVGRDGAGAHQGMFIISEPVDTSPKTLTSPMAEDVVKEVTRELGHLELRDIDELEEDVANTIESRAYRPADQSVTATDVLVLRGGETGMTDVQTAPEVRADSRRHRSPVDQERPGVARESMQTMPPVDAVPRMSPRSVIDLDAGAGVGHPSRADGPGHVLIVDDDFATRHLLVKVLRAAGVQTATAAAGGEAIRQLRANPPDIIICDVMLPEMDGFQICQAVKQSKRYHHIGVLLMSAVISSERITADILQRYGAEGYYEKPIDTDAIRNRVEELLRATATESPVAADDSFERAIAMYKSGYLDSAIEILRAGLDVDPLSPKHHFVLANLLQKKSLIYEAIEAYEATVDLKPDYFPALTRLAYLYYKKGFAAKAAQVWERSLQYCTDNALRQNIEEFIATLRAEMTATE